MPRPGNLERFDVEVSACAASLAPLREALRAWLVRSRVADHVADDLTIATNEAVANAIEHGSRDGSATVRVRATRDGDALRIEVIDSGGGHRPHRDDPHRGRGLAVMRALTDSLVVDPTPGGTTVRLERAL